MASRREEKERRRQERLARERAQLEEARKRRTYSIAAGGVLVIGAIVAVVIAVAAGGGGGNGSDAALGFSKTAEDASTPPPQRINDLAQAARAAKCVVRHPPIAGRTHTTSKKIKYNTNPPTSGNHNPIPQPDGVYTRTPPFPNLVHTLEHGRVELQYKPSIRPKRIAQLGGLYNEDKSYTLLFPNASMPYGVAVTAWGHLAGCRKVTDETFDVIRAFKRRYLGTAPESLESQPTNF